MKKIVSVFIIALGLGLLSHSPVSAAATNNSSFSPVEVNLNGEFIQMDVNPVIDNSRLYIPIRTFASLGFSYAWNPSTKITTIQNKEGDYLKITVNSQTAYKNEETVQMDAPAKNIDGRVLVPIRFVTESLGYNVQYESIRKIVFVTSKDYKFDVSLLIQDDLKVSRRAAISLPVTSNFKTLGFNTYKNHTYIFPAGKTTTYLFYDGYTTSVVQIKDGKAILEGQFVRDERGLNIYTVGTITDYADPALEPLPYTYVKFSKRDDVTTTYYYEDMTEKGSFTSPVKVYSDIIQKVPNNI